MEEAERKHQRDFVPLDARKRGPPVRPHGHTIARICLVTRVTVDEEGAPPAAWLSASRRRTC
jgi:hypothetical protein